MFIIGRGQHNSINYTGIWSLLSVFQVQFLASVDYPVVLSQNSQHNSSPESHNTTTSPCCNRTTGASRVIGVNFSLQPRSLLQVQVQNFRLSDIPVRYSRFVNQAGDFLLIYWLALAYWCSNLLWRIFVFVYIYLRILVYSEVICEMTDASDRYALFVCSDIS